MVVRDQIRNLDEYQTTVQQQKQAEQAASANAGPQAGTVGQTLGPVLDWEKTDVEFWAQIAQVFLLYLILRELQRPGGGL